MTEWNTSIVRHIPEEELHAYLDQALSRSQCVEIERHLARCVTCQASRDDIAGLRDRTTELLARLGPPPILVPPYSQIQARHLQRQEQRRRRWIASGAWAASLVGALALGWGVNVLNHWGTPSRPAVLATATPAAAHDAPAVADLPVARPTASAPVRSTPRAQPNQPARSLRLARREESGPSPGIAKATETDVPSFLNASFGAIEPIAIGSAPLEAPEPSSIPMASDPGLHGLWRTIVPDSSASDMALVPGLPVVQTRVQSGANDDDVTAVDQMLETGEMIRTIAGPAEKVSALVGEEEARNGAAAPTDADRLTVTIRQGGRMVAVTGPSQALGSLLSRVNARRRY